MKILENSIPKVGLIINLVRGGSICRRGWLTGIGICPICKEEDIRPGEPMDSAHCAYACCSCEKAYPLLHHMVIRKVELLENMYPNQLPERATFNIFNYQVIDEAELLKKHYFHFEEIDQIRKEWEDVLHKRGDK